MGFTVVIPGEDLNEVELITVFDDAIPAAVVEVVVGVVDELYGCFHSSQSTSELSK